jgi:hypothetical protein
MSKLLIDAKQRSRMVSFRASQEEYDMLRKISVSKGARSVSEFARSVACRDSLGNDDPLESPQKDNLLTGLNDAMSALDNSIRKLIETLESMDKQKGQ